MLHNIGVVCCLSPSVCQVGFSNDVVDNFLAILAGTCDTSGWTYVEHPDDSLTEMLQVTVFWYWSDIFLDIYVHILHF